MFYRRIFCTGQKTWLSISTTIMGILIVLWTITFFFLFLFYCGSHVSKEWSTVVDLITYCPHGLDDQRALGISDSIMDVFIIGLPIPAVNLRFSIPNVNRKLADSRADIRSPFEHC